MRGFRPPPQIDAALSLAHEATGLSITELLIRCIDGCLEKVVTERQKELMGKARDLSALRETHAPYRTKAK